MNWKCPSCRWIRCRRSSPGSITVLSGRRRNFGLASRCPRGEPRALHQATHLARGARCGEARRREGLRPAGRTRKFVSSSSPPRSTTMQQRSCRTRSPARSRTSSSIRARSRSLSSARAAPSRSLIESRARQVPGFSRAPERFVRSCTAPDRKEQHRYDDASGRALSRRCRRTAARSGSRRRGRRASASLRVDEVGPVPSERAG